MFTKTGKDGIFSLENLPRRATLMLNITSDGYASKQVTDIQPGSQNVRFFNVNYYTPATLSSCKILHSTLITPDFSTRLGISLSLSKAKLAVDCLGKSPSEYGRICKPTGFFRWHRRSILLQNRRPNRTEACPLGSS